MSPFNWGSTLFCHVPDQTLAPEREFCVFMLKSQLEFGDTVALLKRRRRTIMYLNKVSKISSLLHKLLLYEVVNEDVEPGGHHRLSHAWKGRLDGY